MRTKRGWKLAAALCATGLWLWFIYARSAQNAAASDSESGAALDLIRAWFPWVKMLTVRKLAHFAEFFLLGALLYLDWRLLGRGGVLLPLGAGLFFASADEFLQTFVPGRSGQLSDVLLDFSGIAFAVGLLLLFCCRKEGSPHEIR